MSVIREPLKEVGVPDVADGEMKPEKGIACRLTFWTGTRKSNQSILKEISVNIHWKD